MMFSQTIHSVAARICSGNTSTAKRSCGAILYGIAAILGDAQSKYDLGFMLWQCEIPLIPSRFGPQLIISSAKAGFQPAIELSELWVDK